MNIVWRPITYVNASATSFMVMLFVMSDMNNALTCKCTQDSLRTKCRDGICEAPGDPSSCLMLEHPTSGRHYTCSAANLPDRSCIEKVTKTGIRVNVCSCNSSDYCNSIFWPPTVGDEPSDDEDSDYYNNPRVAAREIASESLRERSTNAADKFTFKTSVALAAVIAHTSILIHFLC